MGRKTGLSVLGLVAVFGLGVMANEKAPESYAAIMKSNTATQQSLGKNIPAKDYDAIARDAATFKTNFVQAEAFWVARKTDDAIGFARAAGRAAADLEAAAKAKNDEGVALAAKALTGTCGACHMAHRVRLPDWTFEIK